MTHALVLVLLGLFAMGPAGEAEETAEKESQEASDEVNELKKRLEELTERLDDVETEQATSALGSKEGKIHIYGFFALDVLDWNIDDELLKSILYQSSTFSMVGVNLAFSAQMTESLSAMAEIRYTFLPLGEDLAMEIPLIGQSYLREDSTVVSPLSNESFVMGGLMIERITATWQPADYFGIKAGRFLTPFGIWNIDHGAPVLITSGTPYMMMRKAVPLAQTGLQLFGRVFPAADMYVDYALTLSNGRGPIESYVDLDDNKAGGLRLRFTYEGNGFRGSLGGYLYYGDYTDKKKVVRDSGTIDLVTTDYHHELTGSLDLLIEFHGLRLQSEFVRGKTTYSVRGPRVIFGAPAEGLQPDFIQNEFYGLIAYELPLGQWLGDFRITPYFMYENSMAEDFAAGSKAQLIRTGLNLKPSPYLVLKAEFDYVMLPDEVYSGNMWALVGQMAVSF